MKTGNMLLQSRHIIVQPMDSRALAIISIGPETDAIIDRFGLDDSLVPHLRVLTRQVRSSRWETVLRTPKWGLSYEQSANLAGAMRADICGRQDRDIQV